jgi:hypothetical protein
MTETEELIKEILKWVKILGWSEAKKILKEQLQDDVDVLIYHFSDGEHGIREIIPEVESRGLKTSYGGIHGKWQRWAENSIVFPVKSGSGIRYVKKFDVEEFGFEIPENIQ